MPKAKSAKQLRLESQAAFVMRMVAEPLTDKAEVAAKLQGSMDLHGYANLSGAQIDVIRFLMADGFKFDFCSAEGLGVEGAVAKAQERAAQV